MKKIFSILLLLSCFYFSSYSQTDTIKNNIYIWLSAGSGLVFPENFGLRGAFNIRFKQNHVLSILYQKSFVLEGIGLGDVQGDRITNLDNGSVLYGFCKYQQKNLALIFSSGISFGYANYRGNFLYEEHHGGWWSYDTPVFEQDSYYYLGLPLDVKLLVTSPIFGIDINIYANLHKHPDYGLIFNYNLGKIR